MSIAYSDILPESVWADEVNPVWHEPAEMTLIGGCLLDPEWIPWAARRVKPEHLFRPAHKMLWATMIDLVKRGKEVNTLTLEETLESINRLKECGGANYPLHAAAFSNYVVGTSGIVSACEKILTYWTRRQISELGNDAWDQPIDALVERFEGIKSQSAGPLEARSGHISKFGTSARRKSGCPSGLDVVDTATITRGWPDGQMSVIAAYTGSGKSAMMLGSALHIAKSGGG